MQAKTTLGVVFTTWKKSNDGSDEQLMTLLGASPRQYRELANEVLKSETSGDTSSVVTAPNPSSAAIKAIANRHGISATGLTGIIKNL